MFSASLSRFFHGGKMKILLLLFSLLVVPGCAAIQAPIIKLVKSDVDRAKELADKYGDAVAARCYTHLSGVLGAGLSSEDTSGLISAAELARLLRMHIDKNEAAFKAECGPLAGEIVMELARRVRN